VALTDRVLTGVGAELKRSREAAGLAVDEVAQRLKLMARQIESLEHEHFDRLPGPAITRGMVRNYARLLKLDPEPLIARLAPAAEQASERGQVAARPRQQKPPATAGRRSTLLFVGFSIALLVLVGAAAYEWQQHRAVPESAAPLEPQAAAERKPVEPVAKPVEEPAAREKPQVALADAQPPAKPEPEIAAAPAVPPGIRRLVLRMEEEAWLEVRDGAGRSLVSSLHPAGSERTVRGQPPFQLVIGNAAHVKLIYDGKPVELKPHTRGEVARLTLK
jgi:cytoskeleton protein RodZ